ncbi:MAG: CoA-binding protein [Cyanobacteria bacterium TGS_CYA1]|nr:CoA-binding protein [Cyanobacteria bacterium TGS_CYA1]
METLNDRINRFLAADAFAVLGASQDTHKYGYKVFKCYVQNNRRAFPVNPNVPDVMGYTAYPNLASLPELVKSISIITPPPRTERLVDDAIKHGVTSIWMQPGAESALAVKKAQDAGIDVIYGGPCVLVVLGYRE